MAGRFVESAFRSLAVAAGIGAGVAGGFTVNQLFAIYRTTVPYNNTAEPIDTFISEINSNVVLYTQVTAGLALGLGALTLFLVLSIFIRLCRFEVGKAIKCIFAIDFLVVLVCLVGFAVGGVLGILGTLSWSRDFVDDIDNTGVLSGLIDVFEPTRTLLLATTVTSLFTCLVFVLLKYWLIIFCARNTDLIYDGWI